MGNDCVPAEEQSQKREEHLREVVGTHHRWSPDAVLQSGNSVPSPLIRELGSCKHRVVGPRCDRHNCFRVNSVRPSSAAPEPAGKAGTAMEVREGPHASDFRRILGWERYSPSNAVRSLPQLNLHGSVKAQRSPGIRGRQCVFQAALGSDLDSWHPQGEARDSARAWGSRLHSWCLSHFSGAVRDNADGGTLQPHEVSHLFEPILVNVNCVVNLLVGDEIPTG